MKTGSALSAYESLSALDRAFGEIEQQLEQLRQLDRLGRGAPLKSVELAVRETHAWLMFEVLELLRERAEREWTRRGRLRAAEQKQREKTPQQRPSATRPTPNRP